MQREMRAARFYKVGEPLKTDTIPIPKLEAGDVLVDVKTCGICGSEGSWRCQFQDHGGWTW